MPQKPDDLLPKMIAYLRRHLHDTAPTDEVPPIWRDAAHTEFAGTTLNQKWLERACWLLWRPADAVPACIAAYQAEVQGGHRLAEEMTVSHDPWWLAAHYAIRSHLLLRLPTTGDPDGTVNWGQLRDLNTAWCGAELALAREFYLPEIGVLCPAARFEGALVSPQRSAIAKWDALTGQLGKARQVTNLLRPRKAGFNDTYCLELAADLVAAGDDLGRSAAATPKLAYPLFVEKKPGSLRAYWNPGRDVLNPVRFVAFPTPKIPGDLEKGWVEQVKGLPKGKPAGGSTRPEDVEGITGDFKQIG